VSLGPRSLVVLFTLSVSSCARAPESEICPRIEAGDLVFSELRGNQSDQDSFGHFIEIYNASDRTIDLQGVWLQQVATDGSGQAFFVRESVEVAVGGYVVIGPGLGLEELPTWLDYGVGWDISGGDPETDEYPRELIKTQYPEGFWELYSCDELIDEVFYGAGTIPESGTLSCGNQETPPAADQNQDTAAGCWCVDAEPSDVPLPGIGLPGTPGRANRCP
jgi:hypothetical protein